jgi:ribonucleoside-diphosphate reductase alpha chain
LKDNNQMNDMRNDFGPRMSISEEIHAMKYRGPNETFKEAMTRVANALADDATHFDQFRRILYHQRFLPAGRVQSAMGAPREVTPYNCFVSPTIDDSMDGIMAAATNAAKTMQMGGGIGYDFSTLRPRGALIKSLDSKSSGPISFMGIFDAVCRTISSAGHRRGAQMGVLRVDHPDIEEFIRSKNNSTELTGFNISVGVTDEFMTAVKTDGDFDLRFEGQVYKTVSATALWNEILRSTWDYAEPGVLFIDRMNQKNNLDYCETIAATNPCAEQPLPPNGACLLGSFNLAQYISEDPFTDRRDFDWHKLQEDIPSVVRAMDNVVDRAIYPAEAQEKEAKDKRRMGLGITALANAGEALGYEYGSPDFMKFTIAVMKCIRDKAYMASVALAAEKGAFPLYDPKYLNSGFAMTLPQYVRKAIERNGIRNSHLLSVAPTGTISLSADNVSSGIEPVFSHWYDRTIQLFDGPRTERVEDYAYAKWGVKGKTANELSVFDHVAVLNLASEYVDSACSKTCNVGDDVTWEEFKNVYMKAYDGKSSGCTTFRAAGLRYGVLNASASEDIAVEEDVEACYFDPATGQKTCE